MRSRPGWRRVAVVVVLAVGCTGVTPVAGWAAPTACGGTLVGGSGWLTGSGVNVRSNGVYQGSATLCGGWSTADPSVQDGYGWSSAELAARLYHVKGWGVVSADGGPSAPAAYRRGAKYLPEGSPSLAFHPNGSGYLPVPGDLIVETNAGAGHVSVLDRIDGSRVFAVEQNRSTSGRHSYRLTGSTLTGAYSTAADPGSVRGVLHSPRNCRGAGLCRVSVATSGVQGDGLSFTTSVSADGRYVTFLSDSSNLVPGDTNGVRDVFVRDRLTDTTVRASVASDGSQVNAYVQDADSSADGRYVAFTTSASNLVPGDSTDSWDSDVFVRDMRTGTTTRVSVPSDGASGGHGGGGVSISADGRYVAFMSGADLVPPRVDHGPEIFVRDRLLGTTSQVADAPFGGPVNQMTYNPVISGNGRYIVFVSFASNLVPHDTNEAPDVFVYDRQARTYSRVSVSNSGGQSNGWPQSDSAPAISYDGRFVAFPDSSTNLVAGDTNDWTDVFVRDRQTATTTRVSLSSNGAQGIGTERVEVLYQVAISDDGRFVAFTSDIRTLVPGDTNDRVDAFLRDRQTGTTKRVNVADNGAQSAGYGGDIAISGDGRSVVFASAADDLVPGDTNDETDVFAYQRP